MNRLLKMLAAFGALALSSPMPALAYQNQLTPLGLHLAVSATGLAIAIVLLFEALGLRRVALGGAIAEKLHFVILAIVCLAASALAKWTSNFVSGITFEQTELISELLVLLAMALLAGYFYSVRTAMQNFLKVMRSEQDAQVVSAPVEAEEHPGA
jgi:ABC-type Co2+ transport system permease subunit